MGKFNHPLVDNRYNSIMDWVYTDGKEYSMNYLTFKRFRFRTSIAEDVFDKTVDEFKERLEINTKANMVNESENLQELFTTILFRNAVDIARVKTGYLAKEKYYGEEGIPNIALNINDFENEEDSKKEREISISIQGFYQYIIDELELSERDRRLWQAMCSLPPIKKRAKKDNLKILRDTFNAIQKEAGELEISAVHFNTIKKRFIDKICKRKEIKEIVLTILAYTSGFENLH